MKLTSKKILWLGVVSTLLVGCTTREDELARYRQVCLAYGFGYGTDAFSKCMLEQERMDRQDQRHQEELRQKRQTIGGSSYASDYGTFSTYGSAYPHYREATLSHRRHKLNTRAAQHEARLRQQNVRAEQIRKDEELARKLQAEENRKAEQIRKDEELARKLQAEEYKRAEQIRKDEELARKLQAEEYKKAGIR